MTLTADEEKCPYQSGELFLREDFSPVSSTGLRFLLMQNKWENLLGGNDALELLFTPEPPGNMLPN